MKGFFFLIFKRTALALLVIQARVPVSENSGVKKKHK